MTDQTSQRGQWQRYWPLVALTSISLAAGGAITYRSGGDGLLFMHGFMGFFLCSFAMLKLFNPVKFADGFEMYDIIGKRFRLYALFYPLIELILGLGYLAMVAPLAVYIATIIVMAAGAAGVINALQHGLNINCPCMGSVLNVPLSTVTLTEDIAMGLMAALMLAMY